MSETLETAQAEMPGISVLLPAYNEEKAVGSQVEKVRKVLAGKGTPHEIIVIDDGSSDKTAEKALAAGARLIGHPENRGYGAALKTGITAARNDVIVIIDADETYPAEKIPSLVEELKTADMVVGSRVGKDVHIPLIRRPAKWMLGWLAARIAGHPIPDLNSGMRAFRRESVRQYFSILPGGFSFTTTITLALLGDDYRVVYHPIDYYKRTGKSKIVPRHFMDFMILVLRMAILFQPLKIFVPLAFSCGFIGLVKVGFDISLLIPRVTKLGSDSLLSQSIISTSAILLLLVGLQLLLIGMVADALLRKIGRDRNSMAPSYGLYFSEQTSGDAAGNGMDTENPDRKAV